MAKIVEHILVLVDGTEQSITAAQYAILLAKAVGARLTALYVVNTRALNDLVKARIFLQAEQDEYQLDLQADAERYLSHVRELAEGKGVLVETLKTSGTVHQEVRNEIVKRKVDRGRPVAPGRVLRRGGARAPFGALFGHGGEGRRSGVWSVRVAAVAGPLKGRACIDIGHVVDHRCALGV
jgi:nucleotide-binding universal stress UspA family protein